ncbi:Virus attachment protein p12 family, partial [Dysosmobacter welbionis]
AGPHRPRRTRRRLPCLRRRCLPWWWAPGPRGSSPPWCWPRRGCAPSCWSGAARWS